MEKMQTYYYRDLGDTAKTLKGRGCNSDNVYFMLRLRDMLKDTFGICSKVKQTTLGELNAATFNGLNEAKGFWVHFGLHTTENNFDSIENGDIGSIISHRIKSTIITTLTIVLFSISLPFVVFFTIFFKLGRKIANSRQKTKHKDPFEV